MAAGIADGAGDINRGVTFALAKKRDGLIKKALHWWQAGRLGRRHADKLNIDSRKPERTGSCVEICLLAANRPRVLGAGGLGGRRLGLRRRSCWLVGTCD